MRFGYAVLAAVAVAALVGGCSSMQSDAPEPTPDNIINGTSTQVIQMPDGFRNVAATCRGTTGIYVTSRGWNQNSTGEVVSLPSSIAVLANDPNCR